MSGETNGGASDGRNRATRTSAVRLPRWYIVVQGVAILALLLQAPVSHLTPSAGIYAALGWPIAIVLWFGPTVLRRMRGTETSGDSVTMTDQPPARRTRFAVVAIALLGVVVLNLMARAELIAQAIVMAIMIAVSGTAYQLWRNAAGPREFSTGRSDSQ